MMKRHYNLKKNTVCFIYNNRNLVEKISYHNKMIHRIYRHHHMQKIKDKLIKTREINLKENLNTMKNI